MRLNLYEQRFRAIHSIVSASSTGGKSPSKEMSTTAPQTATTWPFKDRPIVHPANNNNWDNLTLQWERDLGKQTFRHRSQERE